MSDTKFTPGPWAVDYGGTNGSIKSLGYLDGDKTSGIYSRTPTICCYGRSSAPSINPDQKNANAHLIAAAPDMYKALEELLEYHPTGSSCLDEEDESIFKAHEALAKARGQS